MISCVGPVLNLICNWHCNNPPLVFEPTFAKSNVLLQINSQQRLIDHEFNGRQKINQLSSLTNHLIFDNPTAKQMSVAFSRIFFVQRP